MFLTFVFEVTNSGFRCFVCIFQVTVTRTIIFGMDVQVNELTYILKFFSIFKVKLLVFLLGRCRAKYCGLLVDKMAAVQGYD